MNFLTYPPARELLKNMARVIRDGLPDIVPTAAWADGAPAPAGHWLLPEGTRLHNYEDPERVTGNYVILQLSKDAERLHPDGPWHWKLTAAADFIVKWPNLARAPDTMRERAILIQHILTADLLTGDAATATAAARLSSASCHVFPRTVREVVCQPIDDDGQGAASIRLDFTVVAATPAPPVDA